MTYTALVQLQEDPVIGYRLLSVEFKYVNALRCFFFGSSPNTPGISMPLHTVK